jgi:hypothetical protein
MNRSEIGRSVAERLYAAEAAIDLALAETAQFTARLPTARAEAYLSAVSGHRVFAAAAAGVSALTEARGHLVDAHNGLAALAKSLDLDTLAIGPIDKPGEDGPRDDGGLVLTRQRPTSKQTR